MQHFFSLSDEDEYAALWRLALLCGMLAIRNTPSRGEGGDWAPGQPKMASGRRAASD